MPDRHGRCKLITCRTPRFAGQPTNVGEIQLENSPSKQLDENRISTAAHTIPVTATSHRPKQPPHSHRFSEPTEIAQGNLPPSTAGLKLDNDGSFLTTRCCFGTAYSTSPVKQQVQLYTFHTSRQARFSPPPKTHPATNVAATYRPNHARPPSQHPTDLPPTTNRQRPTGNDLPPTICRQPRTRSPSENGTTPAHRTGGSTLPSPIVFLEID